MSLSLMKRSFEKSLSSNQKRKINSKRKKRKVENFSSDAHEEKGFKETLYLLREKQKYEKENNLKRNLKILEQVEALNIPNKKLMEKVMEHEDQVKRRLRSEVDVKKNSIEKSVFSDKDFEDFGKEYSTNLIEKQ